MRRCNNFPPSSVVWFTQGCTLHRFCLCEAPDGRHTANAAARGVFHLAIKYPIGYYLCMNIIQTTQEFSRWLAALRDLKARTRIAARIKNATAGNFGDHKNLGGGLFEMRVDVGAGYRVYYTQIERVVYLLLCGGDKSTQNKDIERAKEILKEMTTK